MSDSARSGRIGLALPPCPFPLYSEIYRCMYCAATTLKDGVQSFVQPGPNQTIPVSHFGDISNAKIWLIGMNPEGGGNFSKDSNVGFVPAGFLGRAQLDDAQVGEAFGHFSSYFKRPGNHPFFDPWIERLNGIELDGKACTWQNGEICCVDLVKCPTKVAWQNVFHNKDRSAVSRERSLVYGCFRESGPNYLKQQVDLHKPLVLIFCGGLAAYYRNKGISQKYLKAGLTNRWPQVMDACSGVWTLDSPARISIGLGSKKAIERIEPTKFKEAIQSVIISWVQKRSQS